MDPSSGVAKCRTTLGSSVGSRPGIDSEGREPGLKSTRGPDLSYEGKRVFYQQVPPGESRSQGTWVTHPWILADLNGTCLKLFVTTKDTTTMQLGP